MVHFCCVPGCSNRSDRERQLSYYGLPLKNKKLLKEWIHKIGRKNLPLNSSTRICSEHFLNASGRLLRKSEAPSQNLPLVRKNCPASKRKSPVKRISLPSRIPAYHRTESTCTGVNTERTWEDHIREVEALRQEVDRLKQRKAELELQLEVESRETQFRLENIKEDSNKVAFYTGFSNYDNLITCYTFLGPAVHNLIYWDSGKSSNQRDETEPKKGRKRALPPLEEFFLVLVRLRLGLLEKDLAYRFGISPATVLRIWKTWMNFLHLQFKEIPLWPSKAMVKAYMPKCFQDAYPSTRVILDATEIRVQKPSLSEFQQMTFSSYKNTNTYKVSIGISPSGAVSKVYPGSISDSKLTRCSGILDLLESGDSVMADRGFDIQDDLTLINVKLNIPPFLKDKDQFTEVEMIQTRRIASLRIHVERAMERLKNFHIFDRVLPPSFVHVAEQMRNVFCVCNFVKFPPPSV